MSLRTIQLFRLPVPAQAVDAGALAGRILQPPELNTFSTLASPACFTESKAPVLRRRGANRRNSVLNTWIYGGGRITTLRRRREHNATGRGKLIHGQGSEKSGDALGFRRSLTLYPRIALNLVTHVPKPALETPCNCYKIPTFQECEQTDDYRKVMTHSASCNRMKISALRVPR